MIYLFIINSLISQGYNHIDDYSINYKEIINKNIKEKDHEMFINTKEILKKQEINSYFIESGILNIGKIGIYQPMVIVNIGDFGKIDIDNVDKNIINMEINDFFDINKGFLIGGHSSGYWYDTSSRKAIFKNLQDLKEGDNIDINLKTNIGEINKKYTIESKIIGKNIKVKKTDKVIYTCYPNNTSEERLVLFLKEKK